MLSNRWLRKTLSMIAIVDWMTRERVLRIGLKLFAACHLYNL